MEITRIISAVERLHNKASDSNLVWFPLVFLKPLPHELITVRHVVVMTVFFSTYFNMMYQLKEYFFVEGLFLESLILSQSYFALGFLVWFTLVTRFFWNRRARVLVSKNGRL